MGNSLSPALASIFVVQLENHIVKPSNPPLYVRYVDDCFAKINKEEPDELLAKLNNCYQNITFTVEEQPDHFLDTAFDYTATDLTAECTRNRENCRRIGNLKCQQGGNGVVSWATYIEPNEFRQILIKKSEPLKRNTEMPVTPHVLSPAQSKISYINRTRQRRN